MLKTVYGSTKSACGYTFLTSTRLRQAACLATLYHSDIGPSTDGSTATAPRHGLLLMTRIYRDVPSNCKPNCTSHIAKKQVSNASRLSQNSKCNSALMFKD